MDNKYTIQTLQDAITVVEYLSGKETRYLGPSEIAEGTGFDKNKIFRILVNLEQRKWVESAEGKYRLAPHLISLAENFRIAIRDRIQSLNNEFKRYMATGGKHVE